MRTVGVRELKQRASEILRRVREDGAVVELTYRGRVVAHLVPLAQPASAASPGSFWRDLSDLSKAIDARWPAGTSAVEAVREGRREI